MIDLKKVYVSCLAAISVCSVGHAAPSDKLFAADRMAELCGDGPDGERYVGRGALALAMYNAAGLPAQFISEQSKRSIEERAVKIMRQDTLPLDFSTNTKQKKGFEEAFEDVRGSFQQFLAGDWESNKYYTVRTSISGSLLPKHFFGTANAAPVITIVCEDAKAPMTTAKRISNLSDKVRLRGKVDDLLLAGNKVDTASPAQISFTNNTGTGKKTAQVDGVLGFFFDIGTEGIPVSLIPYVEYHNKRTTKQDTPVDKIETLTIGGLFSTQASTGEVEWDLSLAPQYVIDIAEDVEFWKGEGFLDPSFSIGSGVTVGRYNIMSNGDVWIKPDVKGILEAGHVVKDGQSPILKKGDDFFGIGGEVSLSLFFPNAPLIGNFVFGTSYRHVELFSLPIDHAAKWIVSADYKLGGSENYTLSFDFEKGRNAQTYQDEESWKVSLGLRF